MREKLLKFIDELSDFLLRENRISNCHLVDFMTADLFRVLLPSALQEELMDMSPADLSLMPTGIVDSQRFPQCEKFLSECRKFSPCQLAQMFPMSFSTTETDDHTDQFHIGPQKSYEVGRMTSLVSHLAIKNSITQVVDIGSGKGYLSSNLASNHGLKVIGFDSCDVRTNSAVKRQNFLQKRLGTDSIGSYTPVQVEITENTHLDQILELHGGAANQSFLICGLHTCGNLATSSIRLFTKSSEAKTLCIVGCCYNLIKEEFDSDDQSADQFGFPMSSILKGKRFCLGRNARMLAAQAVQRIADLNRTPSRSLFWRALLQQILVDHGEIPSGNVGRKAASNSANFHEYTQLALLQLKSHIKLSNDQIDQYLEKFSSFQTCLNAFVCYRAALAPCIECLIMADRLLYLIDQTKINQMEVNIENFEALKPVILQKISTASFVAMDLEFTGLRIPGFPEVLPYDTVESAYHIKSHSVMQFAAIQLGLCLFQYDSNSDSYTYASFNIYMYPREPKLPQQLLKNLPQKTFLSEFSSLQFLGSFDFDFNKWIKQGISFLRPSDKDSLLQELQTRSDWRLSQTLTTRNREAKANLNPNMPDDIKPEINQQLKRVKEFLNSSDSGNRLVLTPSQRRIRGYLQDAVLQTFRTQVVTEVEVDSQGERSVVVEKCGSDAEVKEKYQKILAAEMAIVENAYGLTAILDAISESKCLVVGHNSFQDVLHMVKSFRCSLPPNYSEFKTLIRSFLPHLIDTKVLATQSPLKEIIRGCDSLQEIYEICKSQPFSPLNLVPVEPKFGYMSDSTHNHEAGYDAFTTGSIFLSMATFMAAQKDPKRKSSQLHLETLQPFLNKLPCPRSAENLYLNLSGAELVPNRSHIFHLNFTSQLWNNSEVINMFSGFGPVKLKWINDHSVFVELTRAKMAGSVMKQMGKIPAANYTVVPCGEFLEKRQKSLISGEGQMEGIGAKNSEANGSGPKKQKIEKFV